VSQQWRDGSAPENPVILLAEDEPVVRSVVDYALTRAGYTVIVAADGAEALAISRAYAGKIDLLLTDVKMPGLTGPELAAALLRERPGIRIVLMTGHSSGEVPQPWREGILFKPFLPQHLVMRIQRELRDCSPS